MKIRKLTAINKEQYNRVVTHPLQSWEWGEFRERTGVKVVRRGIFKDRMLVDGFQLTIHRIPYTQWNIGYLPKGKLSNRQVLQELIKIGKRDNCIFIKLEPNIKKKNSSFDLRESSHPLFTRYTFQIDLTKSESELMKQMKSKTRYNVRLSERKGVKVVEDNSPEAFEQYLRLFKETTKRQRFFAHTESYHRKMWDTLHPAGIAHLLKATCKGETLATWIVFLFNGVVYYPYGASSNKHRDLMASNLIMWEAILWGKKQGAKIFDMWGSLGSNPDKSDPWYGFHRFKECYGGELIEFVGSYDLILRPVFYQLYNLSHNIRWRILRFVK